MKCPRFNVSFLPSTQPKTPFQPIPRWSVLLEWKVSWFCSELCVNDLRRLNSFPEHNDEKGEKRASANDNQQIASNNKITFETSSSATFSLSSSDCQVIEVFLWPTHFFLSLQQKKCFCFLLFNHFFLCAKAKQNKTKRTFCSAAAFGVLLLFVVAHNSHLDASELYPSRWIFKRQIRPEKALSATERFSLFALLFPCLVKEFSFMVSTTCVQRSVPMYRESSPTFLEASPETHKKHFKAENVRDEEEGKKHSRARGSQSRKGISIFF